MTTTDLHLILNQIDTAAHELAAMVGSLVAGRTLDADALNNVAGLHLHLRALTRAAQKGERA